MIIEKKETITLSKGEHQALDLVLIMLDSILSQADNPDLRNAVVCTQECLFDVCDFINEEVYEVEE